MIRGKKNFLPPHPLVMGLSFLFKLVWLCASQYPPPALSQMFRMEWQGLSLLPLTREDTLRGQHTCF